MRHSVLNRALRAGMRRKPFVAVSVGLLAMISLAMPVAAQPKDRATQALEHVARQQGLAVQDLAIIEADSAQLPLSGIDLADFKVMARDGRIFTVSFDTAADQIVDAEAAIARERQARASAYGKLEPALQGQIKGKADAARRFPVAIWVVMADPGELVRGTNVAFNALAARVRAAQTPAADAAKGLGAAVQRADLSPVIFAELNAAQINALAQRPDVLAIEAIPQNIGRHNDDSATSDRFSFIWASANGAGTKVAVHEDDGVDDVNTFLVNPVYWCSGVGAGPGGAGCSVGKNIGSHATNVAGVIASTHRWRRGGAWGIASGSLLSANFQSFGSAVNMVNSADWALQNGADTVNMSWGGCSNGEPNFFSRWVDYLVKTHGDSVVVSSANSQCTPGTPPGFDPVRVGAPSLGWNTISVGSYFDTNTGLRSDDVFSSFSSWKNPRDPNSGRRYEKPDVAGMGGQVDGFGCHGTETTAVGGGVGDTTCGTSFAAPDVSALTALVVGKDTTLRGNAETVKAIIMAGATHNIVDGLNYGSCPASPVANDCRDGAGAIDAYQTIQNIVVPTNWRSTGSINPNSFDANGNIDYVVNIASGKPIRVALAWNATATCANLGTGTQACSNDVLNADLDLFLVDPSGSVVASSASFQNSAEVIDYTTAASGNFKVRIHKDRFDAGTNTFAGVAWNLNRSDSRNPLTGAAAFTLNSTKTAQTNDRMRSFWDSYSVLNPAFAFCEGWDESGLEKVYRVTTTSTGAIQATLSNIVGYTGANNDLDLFILKKAGTANAQNTQTVACGDNGATASSQPAGTYYVVVDGFEGSVAKFDLTVNFTAGAAVAIPEPKPQR